MNTQTLFELDPANGNIEKAEYSIGSFFASSTPEGLKTMTTHVLKKRENCIYFEALNMKNAIRKGLRLYQQNQRIEH